MTNLGQDEDRKGLTKGRTDRKYNFTLVFPMALFAICIDRSTIRNISFFIQELMFLKIDLSI